ncbi:MAG: hypothetical protein IJE09_00040 [Oscillospiraceae bacterium]|nr:hypothetical protein [Oscillospiraceae bacterium]
MANVNIKEIVGKLIEIIQDDDKFEAKFDANPAKAIEEVIGMDLPDDTVNKIVKAVKAKEIQLDNLDDILEDKGKELLGKLFK